MVGDKNLRLVDVALYKEMKPADLPEDLTREFAFIVDQLKEMGLSFYKTCNGTVILTFKGWEIHFVSDDIGLKHYIYERSG